MLLWTDDKEYKYQKLYVKLKGTPLENIVNRLSLSRHVIYTRPDDNQFWRVLRSDQVKDTRCNQRRARIRRYVRGMVDTFDGEVYLCTLTFDDSSLALLSATTRLRYVREYLQANTEDYMACIDFGKKTGREHFHALVCIPSRDLHYVPNPKTGKTYLQWVNPWRCGFHSLKPLRADRKSLVKSCAYVFKASNYSFKNADSEHRPFHARGVEHFRRIRDEWDIEHFERLIARRDASSVRLHTPSGFEGENAKKPYETPYCWCGQSLTYYTPSRGRLGETIHDPLPSCQ